ncbi:hypothetical protein LguiB_033600 [Lonicera macranthoides]
MKHSRNNCGASTAVEKSNSNKRKKIQQLNGRFRLQEVLFNPDYILKKVFRKDGPPLGVEFDSLPSHAFHLCQKDSRKSHRACQENQRVLKKRKVSNSTILENQCNDHGSAPVKKHGIGKGLMTVWRVTNPAGGDFPCGVDFSERTVFKKSTSVSKKPPVQEKKKRVRRQQPVMVECPKIEKPKQQRKEKCDLALEGGTCHKDLDQFAMLVDDEELELRELQAGPNPLTCCAHFSTNKLNGCSLCKDLLAKFPPNSVSMKQLLCVQPWDSSPELVKKLFKPDLSGQVFHFLCTYAVTINIDSFTFDEFAQAFLDKVEHQDFLLKFWKQSLNSLTWTEILRQVLVAAGFGSKHGTSLGRGQNKEINLKAKYGLSPHTLKGELFSILSSHGNSGLKVSEMAKSSQIGELNLASTTGELELLITSVLSSDITLFEKISISTYRLRITSVMEDCEVHESDSEDFGGVDDDSKDSSENDSAVDSDCDSGASSLPKLNQRNHCKDRKNMLTVYNEIDESHPGEAWVLGLMEGEYSELNIEEKLDALVALIDLLSAGSSIRMEVKETPLRRSTLISAIKRSQDAVTSHADCVPSINHTVSGGKIKRSTAKQHNLPRPFGGYNGQMLGIKEVNTRSGPLPIDSLASLSKGGRKKNAKEIQVEDDLHPMQSIFLGSDRRYNRYWLFLGPCNAFDPGHKRIYFESSEDGHWEVIDTEEALCTLLSALDRRGAREAHLLSSLEKREVFLCQAMSSMPSYSGISEKPTQSDQSGPTNISREDSSSAISDVDNNIYLTDIQNALPASNGTMVLQIGKKELQKQKWNRSQAFDAWTWSSFYSDLNAVKHSKNSYLDSLARCECCHDLYWRDEKHCKICHTTFELDFDLEEKYVIHASTCRQSGDTDTFPKHKVLSSQLQSLKAASYAIESFMPEDALLGAWRKSAHKLWVKRLRRTSTLSEFLQVLGDFVGAISEDWLEQCNVLLGSDTLFEEIIGSFSTMPQTSSAVALWLVKLDVLVASHLEKVHPQKKRAGSKI